MGESMSKRLKLQLGGEAEMEERAFANPYPDYQPQGAVAAPSAADTHRDRAPCAASSFNTVRLCHLLHGKTLHGVLLQGQMH
uniref:Uncharacterized protein n=1 Tax=Ficedula albicollis TaxID=59894 RepID=A0A803VT28_FICAL